MNDVFLDAASLAVALDVAYDTSDLQIIKAKVAEFRASTSTDAVPPDAWTLPGWAEYCRKFGWDPEVEARAQSNSSQEEEFDG
jgi:hypothetical protein